jgi:threonine dehydrogenase-like Zn-dependent dehydrogenase
MAVVDVPVIAVGVSGTDRQRHRAGYAIASLGHELVGRRPSDGALVAIRPLSPCRTCAVCRRGQTEHCPKDGSLGRVNDGRGGFSGRVRVSTDQLYPVPRGLPVGLATLADPLACVLHALDRVRLEAMSVLVIGDGPMAALAAIQARLRGADQVALAVKDGGRADRVAGLTDQVVTAGRLRADHYDVVVEAVGGSGSEPILTAVTAVGPLGRIVALGMYAPEMVAAVPLRKLLEKEATLCGSKAYRVGHERDDFATALKLLATAPGDFARVITATPDWSPDDPEPPALECGSGLKVVYLKSKDDIR